MVTGAEAALAVIGATEAGSLVYIFVNQDWIQPKRIDGILHTLLAALAGYLFWIFITASSVNLNIYDLFGAFAVGIMPTASLIAWIKQYLSEYLVNSKAVKTSNVGDK